MVSVIYNALKEIGGINIAVAFLVITLFIDITPGIKFNPVQFVIKKIGKAFNSSIDTKIDEFSKDVNEKIGGIETQLNDRMDTIEERLDSVQNEQKIAAENQKELARANDESEISRLKSSILDFSNRLAKGDKFTREEYHTIMDQYSQYEALIAKYSDMKNNKIDVEYGIIVNHYADHKDCGDYFF